MVRNLIGSPEAARIAGVSRMTLWRWVQAGKITPVLVVGKRVFFDPGTVPTVGQVQSAPRPAVQRAMPQERVHTQTPQMRRALATFDPDEDV